MARVSGGRLEDMIKDIKSFRVELELNEAKIYGLVSEAIIAKAKPLTPVDTGELINSFDWTIGDNQAIVYNDRDYAEYVELGANGVEGKYMLKRGMSQAEKDIDIILENFAKEAF